MTTEWFEHLLAMVAQFISKNDTCFRKCISLAERLTLTFLFFTNGDHSKFLISILYKMFCMRYNFSATLLHPFLLCHLPFTILCFCHKDKDKSFICSINIPSSWIERDFLSDIFPKVKFIFKLNLNLSFLQVYKDKI